MNICLIDKLTPVLFLKNPKKPVQSYPTEGILKTTIFKKPLIIS